MDDQLIMSDGFQMTPAQARRAENLLLREPANLKAHLKLLGYYRRGSYKDDTDGEKYTDQVVWLIEHRPKSDALSTAVFVHDNRHFQRARKHWLLALKRSPDNTRILDNAAHCCIHADRVLAERLWKRARLLEPLNEEWPLALSFMLRLYSKDPESPLDRALAKRCVKNGIAALKLHSRFPKRSYLWGYLSMHVSDLAAVALKFRIFQASLFCGKYLVSQLENSGRTSSKKRFEVHIGHAILGKTALAKGDVDVAKRHLNQMAQYGDPNWQHDLTLARQLLEHKEGNAVVEYLLLCKQNFLRRLKQIESKGANEYSLPALVSMERDWKDPSMSIAQFQQDKMLSQIDDIDDWINQIKKRRKCLLPDSIR